MTTQALSRARSRLRGQGRLRALREARCLTQTELARLAGFKGKTAIAYIETRKPPLWWSRLCRVADVLGCTTDEVLGRVPPGPAPVDALSAQDRALLAAMRHDVEVLFGPQVAEGWRQLARASWAGTLWRMRGGKRPTGEQGLPKLLPAPKGFPLPAPPADWVTGWVSPRQHQRALPVVVEEPSKRRRIKTARVRRASR